MYKDEQNIIVREDIIEPLVNKANENAPNTVGFGVLGLIIGAAVGGPAGGIVGAIVGSVVGANIDEEH